MMAGRGAHAQAVFVHRQATASVAVAALAWFLQACRLNARLCRAGWRSRELTAVAAVVLAAWAVLGTVVLGAVVAVMAVVLAVWACRSPESFRRWLASPVRAGWRRCWWRRHWRWLMFGHKLNGVEVGAEPTSASVATQLRCPRLVRIEAGLDVDRLTVRPLVGQSVDDWARAADAIAVALGAWDVRIVVPSLGLIRVDVWWHDRLAGTFPVFPSDDNVDLAAVPVGLREDGQPWTIALTGTHLLLAGVTGAGKSSVLWALVTGIAPAIHQGRVRVWACDPKGGMELMPGGPLWARMACADPERIADLLDDAVEAMKAREARYAEHGIRKHTPSVGEPLVLVLIDEFVTLTALADRPVRERINRAVKTLLTRGRAVGVCVLGAVQDPSKEVVESRSFFPTKIGLRLDTDSQVEMVLGKGAREAGAYCDQISEGTPGVAYVRLDGVREPARVRAFWVDDDTIAATAARYPAPTAVDAPGLGVVQAA